MPTPNHLPETRPLSAILPKGSEGGLEFARIVDLLLFHDARRQGRNITLFSDRAGDYHGLDSFSDMGLRLTGTVGYQYKFYPSPLSKEHRKEIEESLGKVKRFSKMGDGKTQLTKWILVTPDDLTESSQRKDGGDVTWFNSLTSPPSSQVKSLLDDDSLKQDLTLEHWGHRKLQALFMETPALCLFYYPQLIPEGATRRRSIEEIRLSYDKNLLALYGRIEFVGMSVYKPEATRGVSMENFYITLSIVGEKADDRNIATPRNDPVTLLYPPGGHHVILGDPGSGKSTLLKFIALAGSYKPLQKRYKVPPDNRLPVLVVLRRYADALKSEADLALLDYILRNLCADFSLPHIDQEFLEYYLETGQVLFLFDGMDELPNSQFKQTVRDRIHCLLNTYPGNTALITSRIVGYENPYRFDEQSYRHHKLARLTLPEMERFVADWYEVRIDNHNERLANVDDLIRILRDTRQQAICELASNPLLLTIIALVHRIDAVLPDERVVLYQKCTETLLNTWQNWKYRAAEVLEKRSKIERNYLRRIEALAYWMHEQAGGSKAEQRAIVPYEQACTFLTKHIHKQERVDVDDALDLAQEFLDFVKKRAGLLLEVGDRMYSFVHLTFQEYLTASYLITRIECGGAEAMWHELAKHVPDPRWHEVIRLLIAGLRFEESKSYLLERLLALPTQQDGTMTALLLGGLLLDGIEAAEQEAETIIQRLFTACVHEKKKEWIGRLVGMLKNLLHRTMNEVARLEEGYSKAWNHTNELEQSALLLAGLAIGMDEERLKELTGKALSLPCSEWVRLLLTKGSDCAWSQYLKICLDPFAAVLADLAIRSPWQNVIAAFAEAALPIGDSARLYFLLQAYLTLTLKRGPFKDFGRFSTRICAKIPLPVSSDNLRTEELDWIRAWVKLRDCNTERNKDRAKRRRNILIRIGFRTSTHRSIIQQQDLEAYIIEAWRKKHTPEDLWRKLISVEEFSEDLTGLLLDSFDLKPRALWQEALQTCFLPRIPHRLWLYQPQTWQQVEARVVSGQTDENTIYAASWMLLYDIWLYVAEAYVKPTTSPFAHLAELTRDFDDPPLRLAHCLRDLAHGKESRADDLKAMVESTNPAYRKLFQDAMWID